MTRFLKRGNRKPCLKPCGECVFTGKECWKFMKSYFCGDYVFTIVPRPPDGTRCRDLDGNIKVVGRDI